MPTPDLHAALHLAPSDLDANRGGELSQGQRQRLRRSGLWNVVGAVTVALLLAAILFAVAEKPLKPVQWGLAGLLAIGTLITGGVMMRRLRTDAMDGRVDCVAGPVRVFSQRRSGYFVEVGGETFRLPVHPGHVRNGARYRVYVTPAARRIVAMEPDEAG